VDCCQAKSFETTRNLLTGVSNAVGTNVISRFTYQNDAAGRRTQRIDFSGITAISSFATMQSINWTILDCLIY
jgi:hypothetical protein